MHSPSTLNAMGPWEVISSPSTNHTSSPPSRDSAYNAYIQQHSASTINTESVVLTALRQQYPEAHITNMPAFVAGLPTVIDLIQYASDASTGAHAELIENADSVPTTLSRRNFMPPSRQLDGDDGGNFISQVIFGRYRYEWRGRTWLLFYVTCHNTPSYPLEFKAHFLVSGKGVEFPDGSKASGEGEVKDLLQLCDDQLIRSATMWANALHESIWVFNNGFWSQDHELYKNIMKADWGDVILDDKRKQTLQNDVARFFDGRERYQRLRVPWKRGVIYYGEHLQLLGFKHTWNLTNDVEQVRQATGKQYPSRPQCILCINAVLQYLRSMCAHSRIFMARNGLSRRYSAKRVQAHHVCSYLKISIASLHLLCGASS